MLSKVWRAGNSARASLAAAAAGSGSDRNANVVRGECARGAGVGCERRVSAVLEVGTIASRCFEHNDYNTNTKYTYKSDICILALLTNVVTVLHRPSGSRHLGGGVSDVSSRSYTTISNGQRSTVNGMFRYLSSCFFLFRRECVTCDVCATHARAHHGAAPS